MAESLPANSPVTFLNFCHRRNPVFVEITRIHWLQILLGTGTDIPLHNTRTFRAAVSYSGVIIRHYGDHSLAENSKK